MVRTYPGVTVEVFCDGGFTDVVHTGFDAGIRLGRMVSEDMIGVSLTSPFRTAIVASPAYLDAHGRPLALADLKSGSCLQYRITSFGNIYRWELTDQGQEVETHTSGPVIVNDTITALGLAEARLGLCYTLEPLAHRALAEGRLEEVLADHTGEEPGLMLYFPRYASNMAKLRAFVDIVRQRAKDLV